MGLVAHCWPDAPERVASGRTRVQKRVQVAHWVGEMAVTFGRHELEKRLTAVATEHTSLEPIVAGPLAVVHDHEPAAPPFDGYEHLAAAQVVQLLGRLPHGELLLIQEYEAAHRGSANDPREARPTAGRLTVQQVRAPVRRRRRARWPRWRREARAALCDQRGGPAHLAERPAVGDWAKLLATPGPLVWVATIDEVVVGYLQLQVFASAAEVLQVYVHPEARELGFGDWLLEAALAAARECGCTVFEGTALPGDRATKNLYERAGIKARKITVSACWRDAPGSARPLTQADQRPGPASSAGASR